MNYFKKSLSLHKKRQGKISISNLYEVNNKEDLSVVYTPGVAEPCLEIAKNKELAYEYTLKARTIAVITDGTAVLGLGNIGPEAAMPVMEGKCMLFKKFADVDAFPICLNTNDPEKIIETIINIAPGFGGINLEDIAAPNCFYIERALKKKLNIPVFHDDQHGTAIVVLAGLINAIKVTKKKISDCKCVISGSGAAGIAITNLLFSYGFKEIVVVDSKGIISKNRKDLNEEKETLLKFTNKNNLEGGLSEAVKNADVFIGVSAPKILSTKMVKSMNTNSIVFALSNPVPEISYEDCKKAGATIIATGRSDFPNQINNVLAFPAIFKAVLSNRKLILNEKTFIKTAEAIAKQVKKPNAQKIIPSVFEDNLVKKICKTLLASGLPE